MTLEKCLVCGASLLNVSSCEEYFNQMLAWDFSDFAVTGRFHHLTVLCYYLQHPSHYSREGLEKAKHILKEAVENKFSDKKLYQEESEIFSSSKRDWKVTGSKTNQGKYRSNIQWSITADVVVKDGMKAYPDHVLEWSQGIYKDLNAAGELDK